MQIISITGTHLSRGAEHEAGPWHYPFTVLGLTGTPGMRALPAAAAAPPYRCGDEIRSVQSSVGSCCHWSQGKLCV